MLNDIYKLPGIMKTWDHKARYAIDAAHKYEGSPRLVNIFSSEKSSAAEAANELAKRFGCVRLYEWGKYVTDKGNISAPCWIAYWWNDVDYVGDKPTGSGYGIPDGNLQPVPYSPVTP
mgnify:CR=1 FL=1